MNSQTRENVFAAMRCEAFAYAEYSLYARKARQNGREDLASVFEKSALERRLEHFAELAELAGLVGNDYDNVCHVIRGESYEVDKVYRRSAKQAAAAGDDHAAARFTELMRDEATIRDTFKAALQDLEAGQETNVDMIGATGDSPLA